jgi:hypothetical protein
MVRPLVCEVCNVELATGFGKDDELVLKCFGCDTDIVPGLATISRVDAVVKEHFVDE